MLEKMLTTIAKHKLIERGDKIIIGLSGGADSLSMAHALLSQKEMLGIELIAVHVNHMLRGEAADADATFVRDFCVEQQLECVIVEVDVPKIAKAMRLSFEEAGRIVRYNAFDEVLKSHGAHKIAVAQNRNDVIETFFINLFRGAGIDGLASIEHFRDGVVIRPLLDIDRKTIDVYCEKNQLNPRHDHTNDENDYVRNKIRNILLPNLREQFNPSVDDAIFKTVEIMRNEKEFWRYHNEKLSSACCRYENGMAFIDTNLYNRLHEAEKVQLVRSAIKRLKGSLADLSYDKIALCTGLERVGAKCELGDSWALRKSHDALILYREDAIQPAEGKKLHTICIPIEELDRYKLDVSCVAVDADKLKGVLRTKTRQPGDKFMPLGMRGHKKIKDYFIDDKIPFTEREKIMLISDDEKIVWVENRRISEQCKITEETKNVMIMSFQELVES